MTSTAKAHEPTMEEILASIRRIIADDDPASAQPSSQPAKAKAEPAAPAAAKPKLVEDPAPSTDADAGALNQDDIDAMLASFDAPEPKKAAAAPQEDDNSEDDDLAAAWADAAGVEDEATRGDLPSDDGDEDVLELTEFASVSKAEDLDDVGFAPEPAPRPAPAATPPLTSATRAAQADFSSSGFRSSSPSTPVETLIAQETGEAVSAAFGSLNNTILSQNARTLDDLVQEMLRPMLKDWLDENLPQIVERLVRTEIERVSRGRR